MANKKISDLSSSAALTGAEVAPIVQSSTTVKTTLQEIKDLAATKYVIASSAVIEDTTTSRTLSASDNGKVIYFTNSAPITVTTAGGLSVGFTCVLIQGGVSQITVAQGESTTLAGYGNLFKSAGRYAAMTILSPSANTFILMGQTA